MAKNDNGFDWLSFKAEVATRMLPLIYERIVRNPVKGALRDPSDIAVDEAVRIAEQLESRLKGGSK